ncbi:hypothetical protein N7535_004705 [Penicillium sp. DV-2018c]|nr:hypothetical protein N7461_008288 [Penicillium sp. DV-2018c]KAJ5571045.1 hypothetical protein N7535_004705 [Penicillium sp. DV-2018c]
MECHVHDAVAAGRLERLLQAAATVEEHTGTDLEGTLPLLEFAAEVDVNRFSLTNSVFTRVGLYMHPYASLINHSCDYNSVVAFDGEELYVKAIRPIKKGEQIFITYTDPTIPRWIRRQVLKKRYFFDCRCTKCLTEPDDLETRFFSTPRSKETLLKTEREAIKSMRIAVAADPADSVEKIQTVMRNLRESVQWPLTQQPYVSCRDELIISSLQAGRNTLSFIHAAIRSLRINPKIYDKAHPLRQYHSYRLAEIMLQPSIHQLPSDPKDPVQIGDYNLPFQYLAWKILHELDGFQSTSCTMPSFKKLVADKYADLHGQLKGHGYDPVNVPSLVFEEWNKLERLVDDVLSKE